MLSTCTEFDRTSTLQSGPDPMRFAAELDDSWSSLRGIHGGYVTSLAVRAAEATSPSRQVRTVAATFLRPAQPGPAVIDVDVLRHGRSLTTLQITTAQGGRAVTSTRVTMIDGTVVGPDWSTVAAVRPAPLDACIGFTPPPTIRHFEQAELRIDPATIPTGDADDARIAGHVRPIEDRPIDAAWLTMVGDWFPPSPFRRFAPPVGGVSIDYTIHLHRTLPADRGRWLEGVFEAATSAGGMALEHGTLSDPEGTLVAETFHTRWTG